MYEWFAGSADRYPDNLALRAGGVDLTYRDLVAAAARVAGDALDRHGGQPNRLGILAGRTAGTYAAYFAGLRIGSTVVPLNTESPTARNADIVRLAGVDVLAYSAADAGLAAELAEATGVRLLPLPDGPDLAGGSGTAGLPDVRTPALPDLAYIVFTSGSTGTPKGVPIRHDNVSVWLSYVVDYFDGGPDVRISQTSDLSWDLSLWNMFVAWAAGGAVVVPAKTDLLTPGQHIDADQITHWFSTPSIITMARLLGDLEPGSMPTLRWSLFGGELLTAENALVWRAAAPNSVIANVYGPTETTCTCLTYRLPDDPARWPRAPFGALPLGPGYPTVETRVVDEAGRDSEEGELLIRGPQRFDGYLDPAQNAGRFATLDGGGFTVYDGTGELTERHWYRSGDRVAVLPAGYAFLGRLDNQVKVQGYRVEPGEVEAAMRGHPAVDDAAVVPFTEDGATELAGYYTGRRGAEDRIAESLAGRLPAYMVPRFIGWLDAFPLTPNGKVDRTVLIERASQQEPPEQRLAG